MDITETDLHLKLHVASGNLDMDLKDIVGEADSTEEISPAIMEAYHKRGSIQFNAQKHGALLQAVNQMYKTKSVMPTQTRQQNLMTNKQSSPSGTQDNNNPSRIDTRTDKHEEVDRSIRGIPIRTFIDEIFKQDRARKLNEGTL